MNAKDRKPMGGNGMGGAKGVQGSGHAGGGAKHKGTQSHTEGSTAKAKGTQGT